MPVSMNRRGNLLYCAIYPLALKDLISNEVCPSAAVEKIWLFLVGMVVFRSIRRVQTPPNGLDAQDSVG
jgi:hypothetical protein